MLKKIFCFIIFMASCALCIQAQTLTPVQYIEQYKDLAIREMKRMGVPAAITLAQGLLETENGNSVLVKKSNNHFGIKCKSSWTATGVSHDDDAPGECFRTYKDAEGSYRDHSNYLRGSDRYLFLFALDPLDYKGWARGLKTAGYATNPRYPDILIKNIEQYNLQQYSLAAVKDVPKFERNKYEDDKEAAMPVDKDASAVSVVAKTDPGMAEASPAIISINGSKCILGKKGVSLLAIATKNDIDLGKLLAFNDLDDDGLLGKDQIVFLQKKAKTGEADYYMTREGETLHDAAQKNGIQFQYLLDYNNLKADAAINTGTKLYLRPISAGTAGVNAARPDEATKKVHIVQPKEGLYTISKKYDVSVQQLKEWNNLTSDELKIGQHLIVTK